MWYKKYLWGVLFGLCLSVFTSYVLLDTFVLTRVYAPAVTSVAAEKTEMSRKKADVGDTENKETGNDTMKNAVTKNIVTENSNAEPANSPGREIEAAETTSGTNSEAAAEKQDAGGTLSDAAAVRWTDNSYSDGNISVTISQYRQYDTTIYVADVQLTSAEYLRTALAGQAYGRNVTAKTSETARENNAILAINGDYYGAQEWGYVLRNGVIYRDAVSGYQEDLVIYQDGSFAIINEEDTTAANLLAAGAKQVLSFGPALVTDGQIAVTEGEEVGRAKASNPRTAIGRIDDLHYIFIVSDGRTEESRGLSLYQLAQFTQSLGAKTVYNLDGGGSSTMVFNGQVVNKPTTNGNIKERSVSDIVYIGYE